MKRKSYDAFASCFAIGSFVFLAPSCSTLCKGMKMAEEAEKKEEEKRKEDPMSSLPEDSKFGIQRMLEMARDDPLHYMDEEAQERVHKARSDLRCSVCGTVLEEAFNMVAKRPKSLQSEHDVLTVMEGMCSGGPDLSIPNYFGVDPPPLAAVWTDRWRPKFDKKVGHYTLKPFGKGAKARQKWRKLSEEGKQKPLQSEENEQAQTLVESLLTDVMRGRNRAASAG